MNRTKVKLVSRKKMKTATRVLWGFPKAGVRQPVSRKGRGSERVQALDVSPDPCAWQRHH